MTKKMKPSKGINGFEDKLSGLPDHLIVHILSFLPTLDAVKTMLLRRFGNLWTLVPSIEFDSEDYEESLVCRGDKNVDLSFARFVKTVLMLHKSSTIDRFYLVIGNLEFYFENPKIIEDIQIWLRFAIDKQVKDLYFAFNGYDDLALPRCVATSQSLKKLELSGCVIEDQPRLDVHMGSLRVLSLSHVRGSNEAFNQLIAGCPSLQELILDTIDELDTLNVTSHTVSKLSLTFQYPEYDSFTLSCPNVKILDIDVTSTDESSMVDAIDVSSLQVVNVKSLPEGCSWSPIKAFVTQFRNVEVFTLSMDAFENFCWRKKINFPVTRWKCIVLWPHWDDEKCLQLILNMVKSSAELEELVIYNEFTIACDHSLKCCPGLSTTYAMPLLKNVTIHRCVSDQLQLVELLLQNAVVLEKLVIYLDKIQLTAVDKLKLIRQVSKFTRASAKASVIFVKGSYYDNLGVKIREHSHNNCTQQG